jgi:annexin A7/11
MGCGASSDPDPEPEAAPEEPEDPLEALKRLIDAERANLTAVVELLDKSNPECRFLLSTIMKYKLCIEELTVKHLQEQKEFDSLETHIAEMDADDIYKATIGWGTDEDKMAKVIVARVSEGVSKTDKIYQEKYDKTLEDLVLKEGRSLVGMLTGGLSDFGKFMCYRVMPQGRRDALLIRKTMTGMGCNDKTLVEILTTRTNAELKNAAEVYVKEFEEDMVERIKSETGGMLSKNYGKWIDKIVEFDRDETQDVPDNVAELAERLYDAGKGKSFGTDEDVFLEILCAANDKTIDAIKQSYADQHDGRSLIEDVISEMTGDLEYSVLARIKPRVDFFCNRLYNACKGLGTNEETVARVLGCMHNADVILLEKRFGEIYADEEGAFNTLKGMLQDELSGDFLDALLMLLEGASPKGHWIQAGLYPGRAKQSATELQTIVTDAYNEEIAVSRGKEPMLGPLDLIGVEPDGLFLTPHVDDAYPPSSPPIEVIFDKAYLLESEVTELDAGNKLLEALKDHVTKCTQWDELNKTNIEVYKPQYIKLAYDMRFVDHVVHQLDEDNNVMIEFCLDRDADLVKEACAGWGTDENLLIKVLCSLSKRQILQVDKKFRERYGQTLKEQMQGELSDFFEGDFKYFMEMLLTPNCEIDADLLYKSMEGWGTNESMLSRIVSTRSNKELEAAKATFKTKYENW